MNEDEWDVIELCPYRGEMCYAEGGEICADLVDGARGL